MSAAITYRDKIAILNAETVAVWLIAVDLRDRPDTVTEDHILRLTTAVHRLEAMKAAA